MNSPEAIELAQLLKEWHDNRVKQLKLVVKAGDEVNFKIQGEDGKQIDLPKKHRKGFQYGVQMALSLFEPFPIKFEKIDP